MPSSRCRRMPARSSSSHPRSVGHSRMSTSWATSAVPSPRVSRRASASRSSSASTSSREPPSGTSSSTRTRRRVSSTPSPSSVRRMKTLRRSPWSPAGTDVDDGVRGLGDRRRHAAGLAIARDGHRAPVAVLPGDAQRVREQGQGAGLAGDVAQDQLDQAGLQPQAGEPGGLGHGALELGVAHGAEQHVVAPRRRGPARRARPAGRRGRRARRSATGAVSASSASMKRPRRSRSSHSV